MGCSPSLPRPGVSAGRCTRTPWSLPAASNRASASRRARCSSYAPFARCPNPNPNPNLNPNASPNPNLTLYPKHPARQEVRDRLRHSRAAAPDAGEEHRGQRVQARPPLARRAAGAGVQSKVDQVRSHVARVSPTLLILPQEPEPEADETCMSETSADDESVAGGRSRASSRAGK